MNKYKLPFERGEPAVAEEGFTMVIFYTDFDYGLVIIKSKPPLIPPYEGGLRRLTFGMVVGTLAIS